MAKRFTFRFDTMLKIRQQREDHHKRVVANRLRQIEQVRQQMAALGRQIREETIVLRVGRGPGTIDIQQAMKQRHWLSHLHQGVLAAEAQARGGGWPGSPANLPPSGGRRSYRSGAGRHRVPGRSVSAAVVGGICVYWPYMGPVRRKNA